MLANHSSDTVSWYTVAYLSKAREKLTYATTAESSPNIWTLGLIIIVLSASYSGAVCVWVCEVWCVCGYVVCVWVCVWVGVCEVCLLLARVHLENSNPCNSCVPPSLQKVSSSEEHSFLQ